MAMSDEGAHTELGGDRQGLVIVVFGRFDVVGIEPSCDLRESSQAIRLVASVPATAGTIHLASSLRYRLVRAPIQKMSFAYPGSRRSFVIPDLHVGGEIDRLPQQGNAVNRATRQYIRITE